jgi:PAS domain S-box-containing protein
VSSRVPIEHDALARIAFDLSPSGMLAVDGDGIVVAANAEVERLFGWPREELIGRPIEVLVPARSRGVHPGHRTTFAREPSPRPMGAGRELFALRRDGSEFPVEIGLNPVTTGRGSFVLASIVDISARRRHEENLRRSQKLEAIGVLAGGIAHDFNNILLGIVGHTELAFREPGLSPQMRDDLERVLKAADRGRQLVQRILLFSRSSEVTRGPVRLDRVVREALDLLRASLPSTIEIRTALDPATPTVLSDEIQIHQVLMNLATNSAHAMSSGGALEVRLEPFVAGEEFAAAHPGTRTGPHARLVVSDTGAGMPPEILERALEPFFTTKAPGEGTGLGLSVIHGIVRSHSGAMEIASTVGRGTTVVLYLPAGDAEAAGGSAPAALERKRARVLFVEDEEILAVMQRRQLEHLGFEVTVHTSGVAALEDFRARPGHFDLVITDDTMPRLTGSALAGEIHRLRPELPILMVSGGDRTTPGSAPVPGVRKVLRKPHTLVELEQAIRDVMAPA